MSEPFAKPTENANRRGPRLRAPTSELSICHLMQGRQGSLWGARQACACSRLAQVSLCTSQSASVVRPRTFATMP